MRTLMNSRSVNMSKDPFWTLDAYTIRARLRPFAIMVFPLAAATLVWLQGDFASLSVLWGIVVWSGGTALCAQLGRDWGRSKQEGLYVSWGGKPTTRMLRHRDASNKVLLAAWHKKLQELCPDVKIPTENEERNDPEAADHAYDACIAVLRERTRDKMKFPLVFEELCAYGFRRNLWGMRTAGITISTIGTVAVATRILLDVLEKAPVSKVSVAAQVLNLAILLSWVFLFTSGWVKIAADAYALRLLESSDRL